MLWAFSGKDLCKRILEKKAASGSKKHSRIATSLLASKGLCGVKVVENL